jgi:hypothetical protein
MTGECEGRRLHRVRLGIARPLRCLFSLLKTHIIHNKGAGRFCGTTYAKLDDAHLLRFHSGRRRQHHKADEHAHEETICACSAVSTANMIEIGEKNAARGKERETIGR